MFCRMLIKHTVGVFDWSYVWGQIHFKETFIFNAYWYFPMTNVHRWSKNIILEKTRRVESHESNSKMKLYSIKTTSRIRLITVTTLPIAQSRAFPSEKPSYSGIAGMGRNLPIDYFAWFCCFSFQPFCDVTDVQQRRVQDRRAPASAR